MPVAVGAVVLLPMVALSVPLARTGRRGRIGGAVGQAGLFGLFFALSAGLLFVPTDRIAPTWALLLVGVDLLGLGLAVARFDALDGGRRCCPTCCAPATRRCWRRPLSAARPRW